MNSIPRRDHDFLNLERRLGRGLLRSLLRTDRNGDAYEQDNT
jgi:hypothetical protein